MTCQDVQNHAVHYSPISKDLPSGKADFATLVTHTPLMTRYCICFQISHSLIHWYKVQGILRSYHQVLAMTFFCSPWQRESQGEKIGLSVTGLFIKRSGDVGIAGR